MRRHLSERDQLVRNSDLSGGWDTTQSTGSERHCPYGWARKGGTQDSGTSTFVMPATGPNGEPCIQLKATGATTWIRPFDETTSYAVVQNHPGQYLPGEIRLHPGIYNDATNGVGLKTDVRYRLELDILSLTGGGLRFERNADGKASSVTWTTVGHKVLEFDCGDDNNLTLIRPSDTDVLFTNFKLWYLGPGTPA